jgi:hypothetical protein
MCIPDEPPIGNLVAYEHLWLSQKNTREDGAKVYPVAALLARRLEGWPRVLALLPSFETHRFAMLLRACEGNAGLILRRSIVRLHP